MANTDLRGQVAVVTGASRGLGRHVALQLASRGARIAVCARTHTDIESVAAEIRDAGGEAIPIDLDVRRWDSVERGVDTVEQRLGKIDILINNAGLGWYKPFEQWSVADIDDVIDVNLRGTIYMTKAVLLRMQDAGYGQIVNVASDLGRRVLANMAPYVASKFGVVGFAGSLLREVKGTGVKIITLTPGIIDTFFGGGSEGTRDESWSMSPEFVAKMIADLLELPRHWVVDEIAIHAMGQDF